ncbi:vacuolating cytotoxin domain-containing protein [Helicobacter pylori]|uniref:Putative vacuolating cytotoxin (VacA)-like protein n=1 Tax=Helicobacter pylori Hp H-24 TaxID=992039 RepID=J0AQE6_HELPX|nr:vacuolating cytotoxin domain-containing protein [Helicobacter pylori]EJB51953.1 putative vacuolating cytotoxin (VacA)-like protein [Helicobacter pylori Hp H-24]EJC19799.1 vacuolating cytotoxin family protein [Helicobacter pylori Hp H-24b]EJC20832.1 vacuolating cytotoxin family protein [Helicobacter pylori Hp H-24c]EJC40669.1 putative vacuolating cytotoxin (VacA)-like protein [Helicobacter pylori Hp M1]EJC44025.1 putative vacuolating cytotoxin (VacA)-like protein [Helicobacter pylori Hp M3]
MKQFKKKPKKIKRSQKIILKRPLWLMPLLISGFASGAYADGTDILGLSWGEKSQKVCVHRPWYALWSCDKWEEKTQQFTGNQLITKTWAGGNAANYYHSQNNQGITANLKNDNGTYFLSGLYNYTGGEYNGGNLDIELGSNATFNLGANSGNSFTSWYPNGHTNVTFSAGTINVNNSVEVGNRVGSGAGTHTGTATLNLNANKVNVNSNINAYKTSQVNIGNANSTITIGSVSLSGDTCSSLAKIGSGANCSTSGPSYSFKGTTNATNTTFSNASGSFTFEESANFSGAKLNGGAFTFNKGFNATNNTAFNSGSFTFKDTSSFNNATFNNATYTFNNQATFQNSSFNGGTFTFNNQTNPANSTQHPQILFENSSFSGSATTLKGFATFEQAFNNSNHQLTIQNASFDNATFNNTGKITIEKDASFNNTSFNTPVDTNNMSVTGSVTLSGKNDLKNGSTLDFGSAKVTLAQGTTFNLTSLGSEKSVTILNSSGGITYDNLLNHALNSLTNALKTTESPSKPQSFAQGLWDMITYNGVTGQLLSESTATSKPADSSPSAPTKDSPQVYQVGYKIGDTIYKLQETFGPNSIIIQALESGTYTPPPVINGSKFDLSASNYINADMPWYDHKYYIPKSQNFTESGTYYLPSVQIWGSYTNSFKQTFSASNSNLVIGYNATWTGNSVSSSDTVSFGDTSGSALNGHCGPWPYYQCTGTTNGTYSAYHVYITANLRSGNRIGTGGAANLVFNGVDSINIANATITQHNAGIYSSSMTFSTQNMDSSQNLSGLNANGKLSVYGATFTNQAKDGKFTFNAGQVTFENTNFNGGSYQFSGDSLNFSNNNQFNSGSFEIGAKNASFNNANFNNSASFNFNNSSATTSFIGDFTNANSNLQIAGNAVFGNSTNSDGSQNTANFNNTGSVNISGNATFDNVAFNGPTNTSVKGQVTLNNITLKNLNAPLSFGDGTIVFNAHSVINIGEAITNGNPITLVSSSKEIEYNNAFSKNLWQLINYQGHGASSEKLVSSAGNGVYDVVYSFNNQTYNFQEVFSPNSISIRRLGVGMVFDYVDMEKSDRLYYQSALGFMTYMPNSYNNNLGNLNNTIYYYDNSIDFYASGKTLFTKAEFSQTFTGQNSAIVFGAKNIWTSVSDAPQSNVIIRFGDNKGAGSNDASGHCWNLQCIGFITGHYEAQKIYITGSIESGNRISSGGGASLNFNGLQGILLTNATLYNRAAGTQSSSMNFVSNSANIQAQNSYFIDDTAQNKGNPNFSFNALNLDFSNSSFRGYVGTTQSVFKFNAVNAISFTNSSNLSSGLYQMQAKSVLFDNSNLSVSVGTSSIKANAISLSQNASINASNHSTLELSGDLNLNDTSSLNLNQSTINVSNNATINDYASLIASNGSHLNFNGVVNFNSANITTSLSDSSIVFKGAVSLGGQFNLSNNSSLDFQGSSAITSNTAFNFYDNAFSQSPITFHQALDIKAPLSLGGNLLNPNNNSVLNLKNSQLVFSDQGSLNIANIDLLSDLNGNRNRVYNIIQADMNGNWYERINFFGMRINDGIYDAKNQTYSFTNPLNNALKITESFKDNQLSVTLSQIPGIKNTLYNIGSEIFNYQKVYNNDNGVYSYSDDAQGVFYLTSSVKGYYNPNQSYQASGSNNTTKNNNLTSESSIISQTYNAQGNPISALHIYNKGYNFNNIKALGQMALKLYPEIKKILGNDFSLSSLNDLNSNALNQLTKLITPSDWKNINELIDNANNSVVQNFNNGALIIGATKIGQTNTNSAVVFGGLGYQKPCDYTDIVCQKFRGTYLGQLLESSSADLGYIDTTFNAKEIYLTGTLGSGNAWGTGGSASVTFNSQTSLILNQANIVSSQTDGIFSMLGQEGINKVFNQAGLANILGEVAMQSINKAGGLGNLIADTLGSNSVIGGYLTPEQKNQTLSQLLGQNNFDNLMNDSGLNTAIKDLIRQKLGFWTGLVGGLAGLGGIDLQNPEKLIGSMSINDLLSKKGLFNQITGFISANDIGQVISVMLQDIVKPSEALQNDVVALGKQMIGEFLGQDTLNSLESLLQNQQIKSVLDKVLAAKGLGPIYEQGLGDLIPNLGKKGLFAPYGLSQVWQKGDFNFNAQGNVFVQNSTFSNANGGTLSFNAGNSLIFAGNNHIAFTNHSGTLNLLSDQVSNINITTLDASNGLKINAGSNNISVSQGDLFINASCAQQSDPTAASATNPCTLSTQSANGTSSSNASNNAPIALNNNDESLVVTANDFNFSGNIYANGVVDFSKIKGSANIKNLYLYNNAQFQANNLTISNQAVLEKNASFVTNNLNIQGAFNNNATQKIEVLQNLVIASNASLSTGIYGLGVGGALNNLGTIHFNLENSQTPVNPLIQAEGIINLNTTQTPFMNVSVANGGTYTLLKSSRYIDYNINPDSLQSYLKLYTLININGNHIEEKNGVLTYLGQRVLLQDKGLLLSVALPHSNNASPNNILSLSVLYNQVKMSYGDKAMDFTPPTLQDYIVGIQGQSALNQIEAIGGNNAIKWLSTLMIKTKENPLFAPIYLENHSLNEILGVTKDLQNTASLISNPNFRDNATNLLELASYTQQTSRLTKLSDFRAREGESNFSERLLELKNKRFSDPNPSEVFVKYSQPNKHPNNLWIQGVGGASFISGGNGTLYGLNVGYDRLVRNVILGGYVAYGYSDFNGNIMRSLGNNVDVGMYARAFLKRNEFTLSANETYGGNASHINSSNSLLSVLNQRYNYNTWTTSVNGNYGYDFMFKQKSVVLKPQVGLSYHFIGLSGMKGKMQNPAYQQFVMHSNPSNELVLTLNMGLESRKYFGKNSYYFVTARLGRDLLIKAKGGNTVRFVGENTLLYRKGEVFNTFASVITGGEMHLWRLMYVNAGVGLKMGLQYQDINITGNVGMRVAF